MIESNFLSSQSEPSKVIEQTSSEIILSVEHVSKRFCRDLKRSMYYGVRDILAEVLGFPSTRSILREKEFWALHNVSFELRKGEAVGLIGANGAGKTTLLKIISGLIKPDTGQIMVKGSVAPLIALGAGFNPVLSGKENIFINMSILGLTQKQIEERYDEVVSFSEIGHAIDAPVNTYSSGMAARLGFSCAIHTNPDILLIDEVLAVGDIRFRMKCYRRLARLRELGTSFLLVSHSTQSILSVCNTGVYLEKGNVKSTGVIGEVLSKYEEDLFSNPTEKGKGKLVLQKKTLEESTGLDLLEIFLRDKTGNPIEELVSTEPAYISLICKANTYVPSFAVKILIKEIGTENDYMVSIDSADDNIYFNTNIGITEVKILFPSVGLRRGLYSMKLALYKDGISVYDGIESFPFIVKSYNRVMLDSIFYQMREWQIEKL